MSSSRISFRASIIMDLLGRSEGAQDACRCGCTNPCPGTNTRTGAMEGAVTAIEVLVITTPVRSRGEDPAATRPRDILLKKDVGASDGQTS